ncbi:MAG: hypothetical protein ACJ79T_17690, partial [Myxococcales bacterium]
MPTDAPAGWTTRTVARLLLRLAPLVAIALAVPRVLDGFGVSDVSWAPPEYASPPPTVDAMRERS